MKKLIALAAFAAAGLATSVASAADFGGGEAGGAEIVPLPAPVLIERAYNNYYEENGNYFASPYPLPYFGLFADWGPQYNFYATPYWQAEWASRGPGPGGPPRSRLYRHRQ
jgi:hypothetical protein